MNSPLVSIGIPTYNNPDGLKKTLDCITNQTYKNLEIIVSDNCSEDPEVQYIISEYAAKDPRIKPYLQLRNIEVDGNYRFVIDRAKGEYFMFAQDDDWWSPGYITFLVLELELNPDAPVAACPSRYSMGNGNQSKVHNLEHLSLLNIVGNGDLGLVCMGLWRKEAFKNYEVRLPVYVLGGDHITVAHALMATGKIVVVSTEEYVKGYKPGRFQVCFENDFWYSFRSWYWLLKTLIESPYLTPRRKLGIPAVALTNFIRACAITGVQCIIQLPEDNPIRKKVQQKFFGAN
jgi:glycosyltransferase involved in cell wall biosynthesis